MPQRKVILATDEVYHVVSRGVAGGLIFRGKKDYQRFLKTIDFYRHVYHSLRFSFLSRLSSEEKEKFFERIKKDRCLVEIIAFCLMPNHFHFLLRQLQERGISDFIRRLQNSYARYFNTKYHRSGALFQAMFKAVRIETDEQLLHVSRYIHLNPVSAFLVEINNLKEYPWSSFLEYLGEQPLKFVNSSVVLNQFKTRESYKEFVFDRADYQRQLQKIKHLSLEKL